MKDTAIRTVVNPDGSIDPNHKWLCTSPTHYSSILVDVTMHYSSDPGSRFVHDSLPLHEVDGKLELLGY